MKSCDPYLKDLYGSASFQMEEAIEMAKKHPALGVAEGEDLGLSVEIHEIHTYQVK